VVHAAIGAGLTRTATAVGNAAFTDARVVNVQDAVRSAVPLNKHSWLFLVSTASQCIYVGAIPPRPLKINAVTGGLTRFAPEISAVITNTDSSSSVAERGGTCNGPYAPMSANEPNHMEYPRILWTQKETACQQLMARSLDVDMAPETRSRLQAHVVVTLSFKYGEGTDPQPYHSERYTRGVGKASPGRRSGFPELHEQLAPSRAAGCSVT
ncbi:unnamed protein product, partial [Rangifer tarandus platyrhynchus]